MRPRPTFRSLTVGFLLSCVAASPRAVAAAQTPDLILHSGKIWTVDDRRPVAEAVAVKDDRIMKVGANAEVLALRGTDTRLVDLRGKLVLPGFNDAHTHICNAVDWFFQVLLMEVDNQDDLLRLLRAAAARVPPGMWITGGDWATFAWHAAQRTGPKGWQAFTPDLAAIDAATPDHPVLLRRYDHHYFVNSAALLRARVDLEAAKSPDYERDPATGRLTGMLSPAAGELVERLLPPETRAQQLIGARGVLRELNRVGITSIHDIARIDESTQRHTLPTFIERSYTDVAVYRALRERGELTVRVHALTPLVTWADLADFGIRPGSGDEFLSFGTLKEFIDNEAGKFTFRFESEEAMQRNITAADGGGFDIGAHVITDASIKLLLDWYSTAFKVNGSRERRFRLIHAWYASPATLARAGAMNLIADVTPFHLFRHDMAALEREIGPERARTAGAWRSMIDHGVRLNLVSDLPGSFQRTKGVNPYNPLQLMYSAVTRKDHRYPDMQPWHPEQAITLEEAIRACTINPAYASREEKRKGTVAEGKLADLVVLSKDILSLPPEELLRTDVVYTIMGGRIVYQAE